MDSRQIRDDPRSVPIGVNMCDRVLTKHSNRIRGEITPCLPKSLNGFQCVDYVHYPTLKSRSTLSP